MNRREVTYLLAAMMLIILSLLTMAMLHEKHYKTRRTIIDPSKPIEERLAAIESILVEDRFT